MKKILAITAVFISFATYASADEYSENPFYSKETLQRKIEEECLNQEKLGMIKSEVDYVECSLAIPLQIFETLHKSYLEFYTKSLAAAKDLDDKKIDLRQYRSVTAKIVSEFDESMKALENSTIEGHATKVDL